MTTVLVLGKHGAGVGKACRLLTEIMSEDGHPAAHVRLTDTIAEVLNSMGQPIDEDANKKKESIKRIDRTLSNEYGRNWITPVIDRASRNAGNENVVVSHAITHAHVKELRECRPTTIVIRIERVRTVDGKYDPMKADGFALDDELLPTFEHDGTDESLRIALDRAFGKTKLFCIKSKAKDVLLEQAERNSLKFDSCIEKDYPWWISSACGLGIFSNGDFCLFYGNIDENGCTYLVEACNAFMIQGKKQRAIIAATSVRCSRGYRNWPMMDWVEKFYYAS